MSAIEQRRAILQADLQKAEEQLGRWQQQVAFLRAWIADLGPEPLKPFPPRNRAERRRAKGAAVTSP